MRYFSFLFICTVMIFSCKTKPVTHPMPDKLLMTEQFLQNPFGHDNTVEAFQKNQPAKFKVQQAEIQNKYYENLTDTIYRLSYKGSVINIISSRGKERFYMADVEDPEIILDGNIVVGMTKQDVINRFYKFPSFKMNIVTVYSHDQNTRCTFVFNDDLLSRIRCENVIQ